MEQRERVLHIKSGGQEFEIRWEIIRQLVMNPQVTAVPGAPSQAAGIMEFEGELLGVYYPGPVMEMAVCAVVLRREDGGSYGLLADVIDGGNYGDS